MYESFETDKDFERKGIELEYGGFIVTIARAGGANKQYAKVLEAETRPYRRAIDTETMDPEVALDLMMKVAAKTLVTNWQVKEGEDDDAKWKKGIEPREGTKLLPVNYENILLTFRALPALYQDIYAQAQKVGLYLKTILEADAKN
jgi:hypothetical protein